MTSQVPEQLCDDCGFPGATEPPCDAGDEHFGWLHECPDICLKLMRAEVERLRKDKERLDWIESRATSLDWNLWNSTVTTLGRNTYEGDNWREAIDAAMEAGK